MKCASCGMAIKKKPIREETGGQVHYYCCLDCFEEDLCRRDKPLRRAFRARSRSSLRVGARKASGDIRAPESRPRSASGQGLEQ